MERVSEEHCTLCKKDAILRPISKKEADNIEAFLQTQLDSITALLAAYPLAGTWYTAVVRFLFPVLAVFILSRAVRSLLSMPHTPEIWGQLSLPNGAAIPLTHWENIIGRGQTADIQLNYPSVSRQHAAICRGEDDQWVLYDLGSKGGTQVNGETVTGARPVKLGDTISLGGVPLIFLPQTVAEREEIENQRRAERPAAMWPSFLWLTVFQVLACVQLIVAAGESASVSIPLAFLGLTAVMWLYAAILRATRCVGFEMETIAFFLCTLCLAVTASSAPQSLLKQFVAILLGVILFLCSESFCETSPEFRKTAGSWQPVRLACWPSRWYSVIPNMERSTGFLLVACLFSPRRLLRSVISSLALPRWNGSSTSGT